MLLHMTSCLRHYENRILKIIIPSENTNHTNTLVEVEGISYLLLLQLYQLIHVRELLKVAVWYGMLLFSHPIGIFC